MSVSVIVGYFLFTGGVMQTAVNAPTITITNPTINANVGQTFIIGFTVRDNAPGDNTTTEQCDPPDLTPIVVTVPIPVPGLEVEYSTKLNSPGSVATAWSRVFSMGNSYSVTRTFNAPGVYTVTVRARAKRNAGYSDYTTQTMTVTVTGTAPLAPSATKKYTFTAMQITYEDGRPSLSVQFTDPTNQYFIVKDENKIDMVFKWKPTAQQLTQVPELATNYDVREINKQYELFSKTEFGPGRWRYDIRTDETGRVAFDFDDRAPVAGLFYQQPAKTGSTTVKFTLIFTK